MDITIRGQEAENSDGTGRKLNMRRCLKFKLWEEGEINDSSVCCVVRLEIWG